MKALLGLVANERVDYNIPMAASKQPSSGSGNRFFLRARRATSTSI
jgi:hypothetical protein